MLGSDVGAQCPCQAFINHGFSNLGYDASFFYYQFQSEFAMIKLFGIAELVQHLFEWNVYRCMFSSPLHCL